MIQFTKGDMMSSNAEALVNTVNTVGVMGKGVALRFKEAFPSNFIAYQKACREGSLVPGKLLVERDYNGKGEKKIIINFPTKQHWRYPSKYDYIKSGLEELVRVIECYNIKSIAIPPLGCGNGGLNWVIVRRMITEALQNVEAEITVYEPNPEIKLTLQKQAAKARRVKLTPARGLLAYAMYYYDTLGENCSLFVANKLVYFLQRMGSKSFKSINFSPYYYGPYSNKVGHLVYDLNGTYLKGYEEKQAKAFEPLEMIYDQAKEVASYVRTLKDDEKKSLSRMIKLIGGFESTLSLEILATVDYIRKDNPGISVDGTISAVHDWSERKNRLFKDEYIKIAYDHLVDFESRPEGIFEIEPL